MNQEVNLLPSFITASAALVGAVFAQVISHIFTLRREEKKYEKEIYQNLFSPIIPQIYAYIDLTTHFYGGNKKDNIDENSYKINVTEHVAKNLKYASPLLIEKYNSVNKYNYLDDLSGFKKDIEELDFFATVLEEYYRITKKTKILNKTNFDNILKYQIDYLMWICSYEYTSSLEDAKEIAKYRWLFDKDKYSKDFLKSLKILIKKRKWKDALMYFCMLAIDEEKSEIFVKIVENVHDKIQ